jgi:antitoxin component of MazEF toxin-antitoxin module
MADKKIIKIGGSLYVALEPYLVKKLGFKEGDKVTQTHRNNDIVIEKEEQKR